MIAALAHLDVQEVPAGLQDLIAIAGNDADKIRMLRYFSEYYVNGIVVAQLLPRNQIVIGFRQPAFPPSMWNAKEATLEGMDRTNNRTEGNNNRINVNAGRPGTAGVPKMGVYGCVNCLQVLLNCENFNFKIKNLNTHLF